MCWRCKNPLLWSWEYVLHDSILRFSFISKIYVCWELTMHVFCSRLKHQGQIEQNNILTYLLCLWLHDLSRQELDYGRSRWGKRPRIILVIFRSVNQCENRWSGWYWWMFDQMIHCPPRKCQSRLVMLPMFYWYLLTFSTIRALLVSTFQVVCEFWCIQWIYFYVS